MVYTCTRVCLSAVAALTPKRVSLPHAHALVYNTHREKPTDDTCAYEITDTRTIAIIICYYALWDTRSIARHVTTITVTKKARRKKKEVRSTNLLLYPPASNRRAPSYIYICIRYIYIHPLTPRNAHNRFSSDPRLVAGGGRRTLLLSHTRTYTNTQTHTHLLQHLRLSEIS